MDCLKISTMLLRVSCNLSLIFRFTPKNENSQTLIIYFTKEKLKAICAEYHKRAVGLESIKYDLEHEVVIKDYEVNQESRQRNLKLKGILASQQKCRKKRKNETNLKIP